MKGSSKALIWVLLVFLVGAAFGGVTTFLIVRARILANLGANAGGEDRLPRREGLILRQMLRQLDLTPRQEVEVRRILEDTRLKYQEIQRGRAEQLRQERRRTLDEIRKLLDPAQEEKLDEFLLRLGKRRDRLRE